MIPRFEPTAGLGETAAFMGALLSPRRGSGETTAAFERRFAEYLGGGQAVFVPSGRMGLLGILRAFDYPEGSEIVLPAFTYFAIPAVVLFAGLKPVFADIDKDTYEMSPAAVEAVLTPKTRAVIPTHLFGRTCDLRGLESLCAPRGIDLVEDCAQSLGAVFRGGKAGAVGRASYFTFGVTKNFTTFSGGMVVCRDREVYRRVLEAARSMPERSGAKLLKEGATALAMGLATKRTIFSLFLAPILKRTPPDRADWIHLKFEEKLHTINDRTISSLRWRPTDAQARAGLRQLRDLEKKNDARRKAGAGLRRRLVEAGCRGLPRGAPDGGDHIFMSFAVTRPDRFGFAAALRRRGVDVSPGYMADCSSVPELGGRPGSCPVSASVADEILHLPLFPGLTEKDVALISDAVADVDAGRNDDRRE